MEARELTQPQPQAFELMLRIRHPSMDPEVISRELNIEAEHYFKAGDPRTPSAGEGTASLAGHSATSAAGSPVHSETYWLATLDPSWWPIQSGFAEPLSSLTPDTLSRLSGTMLGAALSLCAGRFLRPHARFFSRIQSEGGEVRLLVEINTAVVDAFTLAPELGREMNALSIPIDFELTAA